MILGSQGLVMLLWVWENWKELKVMKKED